MKRDIVTINKNLIPYNFDILLAGEVFNIRVDYNNIADMFTVALSKGNIVICEGEPIVYGIPLFKDIFISGKYPAVDIIPYDESGEYDSVTYDNLSQTVLLVIDNGGDDIE